MSKGTLGYILAFSLGAAAGVAVSWKLLEDKYVKLAQEEIDSVIEAFSNRDGNVESDDPTEPESDEVPVSKEKLDMDAYKNAVQKANYAEQTEETAPQVVTPEEFGEIEGYDTDFLTYYADGVLADEFDEPIEDINTVIGSGSLDRIGEYEDDILHVRNDKQRIYYEIARDARKYSDVVGIDGQTESC